jgi:hypothetical protein
MVRDTLGQRQLTWSEFFGSSLEINHRTWPCHHLLPFVTALGGVSLAVFPVLWAIETPLPYTSAPHSSPIPRHIMSEQRTMFKQWLSRVSLTDHRFHHHCRLGFCQLGWRPDPCRINDSFRKCIQYDMYPLRSW